MLLVALDFDGVLCDSLLETCITGWKAAGTIWPDMSAPMPPRELIDGYRLTRPIIETGFEAILMMRLLYLGESPGRLLQNFPEKLPDAIRESGRPTGELKQLFGSIRDRWLDEAEDEWVAMSPFYPGICDWLGSRGAKTDCIIITTKEERFVKRLLEANNVAFSGERIFGLDRGLRKEEVIRLLQQQYPNKVIHFVEDRLPTLQRLLGLEALADVRLYLACWGYNSESDRNIAQGLEIELLQLSDLFKLGDC